MTCSRSYNQAPTFPPLRALLLTTHNALVQDPPPVPWHQPYPHSVHCKCPGF